MALNLRILIERKPGCGSEESYMFRELQSALGLSGLKSLRIIRLYEVAGLDPEELESAAPGLFYESPTDRIVELREIDEAGELLIAREYLPGQFDQRADSAERCLRLLYPDHEIEVRRAEFIIPEGNITTTELDRIRSWLINPVDSRPKDPAGSSLGERSPEPEAVPVLTGFRSLDSSGLESIGAEHGLALGLNDLEFIRDWFDGRENRDPGLAELKALDTYWSDHCRHTTFETELGSIEIAPGEHEGEIRDALEQWEESRDNCWRSGKPRTLMDLATIAAREERLFGGLKDWDLSEEINACTLKVDAKINGEIVPWLLSFKNETHNHPTEIEPYGGASTCLGGAVRDPLSGRAYVHQALRISGGADPRQHPSDTRAGKLSQMLIAHGAAEGYAGYGNQLGLATAVVRESYHPGYEAKRLECGAVMGASPADHVHRERPDAGDIVILVGGRTGRDGIGGATGSSVAHDGTSLDKAGAEVQKGNPPEERKLQRLFRNPAAASLIRRCNDFGAGGVAVAVGELADGLEINLDAVPVKYDGLNGLELALSESQERMAVVVSPADADAFISYAVEENLEAVRVATITSNPRLRMTWRGSTVIDLDRELLDTNGVRRHAAARIETGIADTRTEPDSGIRGMSRNNLKYALSSVEFASRRGLEQRFDGSVGGGTVLAPHGGRRQLTPAMASIHLLPADGDVETAGIMAVGFDPFLASRSPFRGGQYALIEALSRICAAGGSWRRTRFSLQEYFGRTDRGAESWGRPLAALLGALTVERRWHLPAIGGKDSMSGSYEELDVPPTIIAFAASAMDASDAVSAAIPRAGLTLALLSTGSSEKSENPVGIPAPDFDNLALNWDWVESLNKRGKLKAAAAVGTGGWGATLAVMAMGNQIGIEIRELPETPPFAAEYGSLLIAADMGGEELTAEASEGGIGCRVIGRSAGEPIISWPGSGISLAEAEQAWRGTFSEVWSGDESPEEETDYAGSGKPEQDSSAAMVRRYPSPGASPVVCIPVFPGTNGEDDARRSFARAGATPREHVFLDRDPQGLETALDSLARAIENSQILYISGGFSAGDEPDGAGKYIAAVLRQSRVADAISGLLDRDGLILGICNGFQALIKSGWLGAGHASIPGGEDPTLVRNRIGHHVARSVHTVATGALSPWLSRIARGDIHTIPVSHGEGRFTAPEGVLRELSASGRIPFQYCDEKGRPSMAGEWNPNGSEMAVEALLSPCGRIIGKMGHSERWRRGTFIDIPGMEIEQPLIPGGVEWFL